MILCSTFGTDKNFGISMLFVNKDEKMGGMFSGGPYVIAKNATNKELVWEYLKFTQSEFVQKYYWEQSNSLPVIKAASSWKDFSSSDLYGGEVKAMADAWTPRYAYCS